MNAPNSELEWQAFLYVAAEMSPDECDAFERRLLDDQPAREAVARMVELTQTLSAADNSMSRLIAQPAQHPVAPWWHPVAWMSVGALACVLFVVLVSPRMLRPIAGPVGNSSPRFSRNIATPELASAWLHVRQEFALSPGEEMESPTEEGTSGESEVTEVPNNDDESGSHDDPPSNSEGLSLLPPDWMVTAVENLVSDASPVPGAE